MEATSEYLNQQPRTEAEARAQRSADRERYERNQRIEGLSRYQRLSAEDAHR